LAFYFFMKNAFHSPIPTKYEGITYRSRLEARWAVFFEHLDFVAHYESDRVLDYNDKTMYVPDFDVVDGIKFNTWVENYWIEVKPTPPNQEYLDYIASLPIRPNTELFIVVGEPSFYQEDGYWLMSLGGRHEWIKGFKILQCRYCSRYVPSHLRAKKLCECDLRMGHEQSAKDYARSYRFDLKNNQP
jgi:hypothetical protein